MKPVASRNSFVTLLCVMGCALLAAQQAHAQAYPSKNIQMVVPYLAGG